MDTTSSLQHKNQSRKALFVLFLIGFLLTINVALTAYINSSFLETFVSEKMVGVLYTASAILTLAGLLLMPKLLRRYGNYKTTLFSMVLTIAALLVFAFTKHVAVLILFSLLYLGLRTVMFFNIDEFIEHYSGATNKGSTRGLYLTVLNIAWILAPLASGKIVDSLGFTSVYTVAAACAFFALIGFMLWFKGYKDPIYKPRVPLFEIMATLFRKKDIYRVYRVNLLLQFFYVWMVVYMPLYLHQHLGFEWSTIGVMFMVMLTPFVIFQFPVGLLADKKYGEKEFMNIGLGIMVLTVIGVALLESQNAIVWTTLLFMTRVGASIVEIAIETYFFKQVSSEDADVISFFRNGSPIAYMLVPALVSVLLILLPLQYTFFVLAGFLVLGFRFSLRLVDTK